MMNQNKISTFSALESVQVSNLLTKFLTAAVRIFLVLSSLSNNWIDVAATDPDEDWILTR